jgi:cobalt-zinc-cadmium efflux system membrane fusion protein
MKPMNITDVKRAGIVFCAVATAVLLLACTQPSEPTAPTTPETQAQTSEVTCAAHGDPKDLCFVCDAGLRDKGRLWCEEHNRYEDRCWECHPDLQDKERLWCQEHSLYEDECYLCHPELLEEGSEPAEGASGVSTSGDAIASTLMCDEHGVPENECGICHPELLGQDTPGEALKVRLPSPESAAMAGVVVDTPGVQRMDHGVECFAELTFDQNQVAHVTSLVGGVVTNIEVSLGDRVEKGALLVRVTSVAIGEAQNLYLTALADDQLRAKTLERERGLLAQRISSEKEFEEAEAAQQASMAAVRQAQQQLMVLGFDEEQIRGLAEEQGTPGVLELRAPFPGEVVERTAVQGAMVEIGEVLFILANTNRLWAMLNIPESQLPRVQVDQKVELTVESLPGQTFIGTLTWLSASVDRRTRMARGRVEVANFEGRLKAQMFAQARIVTSTSENALVVPLSAVQNVTGTEVVFVQTMIDLFEARPVTLGTKRDGQIEIAAGLRPDDLVVIAGAFALKSQFLISRLGAGCVDE